MIKRNYFHQGSLRNPRKKVIVHLEKSNCSFPKKYGQAARALINSEIEEMNSFMSDMASGIVILN